MFAVTKSRVFLFAYEKLCEDLKQYERELRDLLVKYAEATTPLYFLKVIHQVDKSKVAQSKADDLEFLSSILVDLKNIQAIFQ